MPRSPPLAYDQKCDLPVPQPMLLPARSEVCRAAMAFDAAAARLLRTVVCLVMFVRKESVHYTEMCTLLEICRHLLCPQLPVHMASWHEAGLTRLCCRADCCTTTVMLPTSGPRFLVIFQPNASWDAKEQWRWRRAVPTASCSAAVGSAAQTRQPRVGGRCRLGCVGKAGGGGSQVRYISA